MPPETFETKVLTSLAKIEEKLLAVPDHEKRIRWLERMAWGLGGAWVILSGWLSSHIWGSKP